MFDVSIRYSEGETILRNREHSPERATLTLREKSKRCARSFVELMMAQTSHQIGIGLRDGDMCHDGIWRENVLQIEGIFTRDRWEQLV